MTIFKRALEYAFYLLVLAMFLSMGVSAGFSHDENQFIAAGQLLADHGLLPYLNYPYTHMPYGALLYAISALISPYDFLAGRLLNALAWFICSLLIGKAFWPVAARSRPVLLLLWEFTVVYIFLRNPILHHVVGNALNHSFAALFGLVALTLFLRAARSDAAGMRAAFGAGAAVCIAGLIRFNYASLIVSLGVLLLMHRLLAPVASQLRSVVAYGAGVLAATIPALGLLIAAPNGFIYTNFVYIRLNTIYYEELLYRVNMQLGQKLLDFWSYLLATPLDFALYTLLLITLIRHLFSYVRLRTEADFGRLVLATSALALAVTAFVPSPTQPQYFLAAIPVLCALLVVTGAEIREKSRFAVLALPVVLLIILHATVSIRNPALDLADLTIPSRWVPVQAHEFAVHLEQAAPSGRVLTLLPMLPLETGFDVYPFAVNGPFSWRTSLLLTPERRARYEVASPEELPGILERDPPAAILTGFESTNAGFTRNDLGGLETPFIDYARANGYQATAFPAPFLEQSITLWVKPR